MQRAESVVFKVLGVPMSSPARADLALHVQATRHAEMDAIDKVFANIAAPDRNHAFER